MFIAHVVVKCQGVIRRFIDAKDVPDILGECRQFFRLIFEML